MISECISLEHIPASKKQQERSAAMVGLKNSAQNERYVSGIFSL